MLKIMIADIDIDNVTNFRAYIKRKFSIFELVKPAFTISEIHKNIEEYKPNIIIIEMKFFGNSSFQSIKQLKEKNPNIKLILYGSINESDYMKKLLDYGALAYMYRPVKPSELERCLNEAIKDFEKDKIINQEQKRLMREYEDKLPLFENCFLSTIMYGHLTDENEISSSFEYFEVKIEPPYSVALLRIDHFKKIVLALEEKEKHLLILKILNTINKEVTNGTAYINHFNEIGIIMGGFNELDELVEFLIQIKNKVKDVINDGIDISIGVGRIYNSLSKLQTSFHEAVAALRYRCIVGYNTIIPLEYVEGENRVTYNYPLEREELLVYTAVIGEYNYCVKLLDELLEALREAGDISPQLIPQIMMDILISINRHAVEQELNLNGIHYFFPSAEILALKNLDDARELMLRGLKDLCDYIGDFRKKKEDDIYERAINYINKYYFENITYLKLSQEISCSVEYFKRLFKIKSGKTLSDFIAAKRIEVAKQLILETNMNDEAVAVNVGYDDLNTFRNVFRGLEGYMVGDFRYIKNRNVKQ